MRENQAVVADILATLFQRLEGAGVEYCVLRSYEGLPETFRSDVDFLVSLVDRTLFHDILTEIATERGWSLAKYVRRSDLWKYFFYPAGFDDKVGRFVLAIDLLFDFSWKGVVMLPSEVILRERIRYRGFLVPNPGDETAILLLKDLLSQGRVFPKHRFRIQTLIGQSPDAVCARIQPFLGRGLAEILVRQALAGQWEEIEAKRDAVRWAVARRAFLRAPLRQVAGWLSFVWGHVRRYVSSPTGLLIVVLGSDGSGKTTVIGETMALLEKLFARSRRLAFYFGTVPNLDALRSRLHSGMRGGRSGREEMMESGPHLAPFPASRALGSLVYHAVGYLLGYPYLFITRRLGHLLVMERYFYDYFVQPRYQHIPRWMLGVVRAIAPRPDAVIYLHGDPQLIHDRKPELPVDEIERQEGIFRDLLLQMPNGHVVDVGAPAPSVARQIGRVICRVLEERTLTR